MLFDIVDADTTPAEVDIFLYLQMSLERRECCIREPRGCGHTGFSPCSRVHPGSFVCYRGKWCGVRLVNVHSRQPLVPLATGSDKRRAGITVLAGIDAPPAASPPYEVTGWNCVPVSGQRLTAPRGIRYPVRNTDGLPRAGWAIDSSGTSEVEVKIFHQSFSRGASALVGSQV